ncbi:asparaginase-domain-containing protein [Vararia minispora EC-137]|uniref:Asparaginase-domain-containing protein n=1 Tax=Vararia minispora EC-137 TaxID=1314806 RepID=A0ACB8Q9Z0_9AGAM|nr:asparaginase-domain-containing protein [Vararia minispora EC-137]
MDGPQSSDESKVLIIYTGGTIGMLVSKAGYVPEPCFLTETLRSQARFHDPLQDTIFSHSGSVEGFRKWNVNGGSGRSSPSGSSGDSSLGARSPQHVSLPVRSSRPIAVPSARTVKNSQSPPPDQAPTELLDGAYQAHLLSLVTPRLTMSNGKRVRYAVLEWNPLLDSSDLEIEDWIRIATEIELNYQLYDAFVILHGTDTMAYTASALSFLLEDLGKTVIVTGAQIPLSQLRNDAVDNLLGALCIAGHYIIPECCLFFDHTLYRGNRVSKFSSHDLNAFSSPNFAPLVKVGIDIIVNWNDVFRQRSLRRFRIMKHVLTTTLATLRLFPGITAATVKSFLQPPIKGVVLETFGAGNAPQRTDLMNALREACDRGVVIVAISQCAKGAVSPTYATGQSLLAVGVIPGGDMTPECALAKLSYLLSKPELSLAKVRALVGTPLRGELTRSAPPPRRSSDDPAFDGVGGVLSRMIRLAIPDVSANGVPNVTVTSAPGAATPEDEDATASWSLTAKEASITEGALICFLIHLAVAADDVEGLEYCLVAEDKDDNCSERKYRVIAGGVVNWINPASGRPPLHVAALNGSTRCVHTLLKAGALVHLRDSLGHTALYYAARQGHEEIVSTLVSAGANLGGADSGAASLAVQRLMWMGDTAGLRIWKTAGMTVPDQW